MSKLISRSTFLRSLAVGSVGAAAGLSGKYIWDTKTRPPEIPCRMLGPSISTGHMIRNHVYASLPPRKPSSHSKVVIVGGGIAGLSAAWWLKKQGMNDFVVLELEKEVGGNSTSGRNDISAYPWAAHYVPLANPESEYVRTFFEDIGVIQGFDKSGQPIYDELQLCHDPQERLLKGGNFYEGLVPKKGLQPDEKAQSDRFFEVVSKLRESKGSDGKPAFAIPLDLSSRDKTFTDLDNLSMGQWMKQNGFTARPLTWYVDYCCRDDYGSTAANVSAWAGLHYFAGRRGTAANADMNALVTWPEGNGYIVNKLRERLAEHLRPQSPVHRITSGQKAVVAFLEGELKQHHCVAADFVIFAAPRFIAKYVIPETKNFDSSNLTYAPWLVANLTLKNVPMGNGVDAAWDNVSFASESLGYVVATHQNITTRRGATVITYYLPLSSQEPLAARKELLAAQPAVWRKRIVADLEKMHPDISKDIVSIDLWPWGHGMIRPSVGYIWGETRRKMRENHKNIYFAHSDMSGISNFEEAQYQGIEAAKNVLAALDIKSATVPESTS